MEIGGSHIVSTSKEHDGMRFKLEGGEGKRGFNKVRSNLKISATGLS